MEPLSNSISSDEIHRNRMQRVASLLFSNDACDCLPPVYNTVLVPPVRVPARSAGISPTPLPPQAQELSLPIIEQAALLPDHEASLPITELPAPAPIQEASVPISQLPPPAPTLEPSLPLTNRKKRRQESDDSDPPTPPRDASIESVTSVSDGLEADNSWRKYEVHRTKHGWPEGKRGIINMLQRLKNDRIPCEGICLEWSISTFQKIARGGRRSIEHRIVVC